MQHNVHVLLPSSIYSLHVCVMHEPVCRHVCVSCSVFLCLRLRVRVRMHMHVHVHVHACACALAYSIATFAGVDGRSNPNNAFQINGRQPTNRSQSKTQEWRDLPV